MAGNSELEILIRARDEASATLTKINGEIKNLGGVSSDVKKEVSSLSGAVGNDLAGALSKVSPEFGSIASAAGTLGMAVAGLTLIVKELGVAWDLAIKGADFAELSDANLEIVGSTQKATETLELMRKATQGTVKDFDLLILENRALNMGVTDSAEEMANLAAIFTKLGEASAMSAKESVAAGFQALGALQTRGLKTLGLSLDETKIWDEYAAKLGTTAAKLDDVQKRAALVQAVLAKAPDAFETATASQADQVEAMKVAQENFRTELGRTLTEMLKIAPTITDVLNKVTDEMRGKREAREPYDQYAEMLKRTGQTKEYDKLILSLDMVDSKARIFKYDTEQLSVALQEAAPYVMENVKAENRAASSLYAAAMAAMAAEPAMLRLANAQFLVAQSAQGISDAMRFGMPENAYSNAGPGAYVGAYGQMVVNTSGPGGWTAKDQIDKMAKLSKGGGGGGGLSDYEQELRQQAADLRSMAETLLTPSYRGPDDLVGPYIEQWDEYARKMNAIADDQNTIWRKMVPQDILDQGQEAIAKWAREEEKAFYAGQRLDQVDWGKFVEDAKKQVELQQAKQDMIQMGMQKLAEAGIGGVSAAEVLGLNAPGVSAGAEMAGSFSSGLVTTNTALAVTKAFQDQMNSQQETWSAVGVLCISWFVAGLKKGIDTKAGVDIITTLFPYFKALLGDEVLSGLRSGGD